MAKWIQEAIKHKGALRSQAKRKGLVRGDEKLSESDLSKLKKTGSTTTKRRVNLARTLRKMR